MLELNKIHLGDCYKLIKEIPDNSVDCIYTDVPYKYDMGSCGSSELAQRIKKKKDDLIANDIYDGLNYEILNEFLRISKKVNCYIWCSKLQINEIMNFFLSKGYFFEILVWCKTNPTPSTNNVWLPDLEYCLYFRESGVKLNDGYEFKSKWYITPINKSDKDLFEHPTIKPIELVKRHLLHTTQDGDIVFDPFVGSGTTCVGAKDLNRQYLGIEINPKWHKIACDRLNCVTAGGQQSLFLM